MERARASGSQSTFIQIYMSGLDVSALREKVKSSEQGLARQIQGTLAHPRFDSEQLMYPIATYERQRIHHRGCALLVWRAVASLVC